MNTQQDKLNAEQKILNAATALFVKQGFKATTTAQIAKEAGCNSALLHYYFRTKDKLFHKVIERKLDDFVQTMVSLPSSTGGDFIEMALHFVAEQFDMLRNNPDMPKLLLREVIDGESDLAKEFVTLLQEKMGVYYANMAEALTRDIAAGKVREISFVNFLMDVISLNISGFIIRPIASGFFNIDNSLYDSILESRKQEILKIISLRLKP